jgi:sulfoxide reductase heme-binding subunit YedZ
MTPPQGRGAKLIWLKPAVLVGALVPLGLLVTRAATGKLGANPVAEAMNQLGLLALIFIGLSLACTPAQLLWGVKWPLRIRKLLGLLGFSYATLHLFTYAAVDQLGHLRSILDDIVKRPFIAVGFAAWTLLVPLAVTSTSTMLKRLGFTRWKRLHRLVYLVATLGVIHFIWRVKKDLTEPLVYGAILAVLFIVRIVYAWRERVSLVAR